MKTQCSQTFAETLDVVGLDYRAWRTLARGTGARRPRWIRQFVRKVQRVHTGDGMWQGGRYARKLGQAL